MTKKTNQKKFYYNPIRDIISASIGAIIFSILIVIAIFISAYFNHLPPKESFLYEDLVIGFNIIKWALIIISIVYVLGSSLSIYAKTYNVMIIKTDVIILKEGMLSRTTTTVPVKKIKSVSKTIDIFQQICGSMDLSITAAGDTAEIHFYNIKNGEEAYNLLCKVAAIEDDDEE